MGTCEIEELDSFGSTQINLFSGTNPISDVLLYASLSMMHLALSHPSLDRASLAVCHLDVFGRCPPNLWELSVHAGPKLPERHILHGASVPH